VAHIDVKQKGSKTVKRTFLLLAILALATILTSCAPEDTIQEDTITVQGYQWTWTRQYAYDGGIRCEDTSSGSTVPFLAPQVCEHEETDVGEEWMDYYLIHEAGSIIIDQDSFQEFPAGTCLVEADAGQLVDCETSVQ